MTLINDTYKMIGSVLEETETSKYIKGSVEVSLQLSDELDPEMYNIEIPEGLEYTTIEMHFNGSPRGEVKIYFVNAPIELFGKWARVSRYYRNEEGNLLDYEDFCMQAWYDEEGEDTWDDNHNRTELFNSEEFLTMVLLECRKRGLFRVGQEGE